MQQQQFLQQETNSPLQAVVSPPQVGSPSTLGIPQQLNPQSQQQQQQQASPQQMGQRTPMSPQLSSGTLHPLSGGNPEACPASPQLSSQTLGSVGSITNSPMELQGVNKSNSVSNAWVKDTKAWFIFTLVMMCPSMVQSLPPFLSHCSNFKERRWSWINQVILIWFQKIKIIPRYFYDENGQFHCGGFCWVFHTGQEINQEFKPSTMGIRYSLFFWCQLI